MNPASLYHKLNNLLAFMAGLLRPLFLLIIRLYWGWQFFVVGKAHLAHLDKTTSYFASLNIPMPKLSAIMAGSTECVGGLLLLAGLFSRFASLALICVMSVALWTAEREAVRHIFSDPDKFLATDPFLFLYAAVLVFAFGPGRISLDALVFREKTA
jgi:putative oxidoreductase